MEPHRSSSHLGEIIICSCWICWVGLKFFPIFSSCHCRSINLGWQCLRSILPTFFSFFSPGGPHLIAGAHLRLDCSFALFELRQAATIDTVVELHYQDRTNVG